MKSNICNQICADKYWSRHISHIGKRTFLKARKRDMTGSKELRKIILKIYFMICVST